MNDYKIKQLKKILKEIRDMNTIIMVESGPGGFGNEMSDVSTYSFCIEDLTRKALKLLEEEE